MAGRKAQPTALKLLKNNPGKRALNEKEPKPRAGLPDMPAHFVSGSVQSRTWESVGRKIESMRVMTEADAMALEMLCEAYAEFVEARKAVAQYGSTYSTQTENGVIVRARPEVAMASDAWRRIVTTLREFGLTPSARTKVQTVGDGDRAKNPWEEIAS